MFKNMSKEHFVPIILALCVTLVPLHTNLQCAVIQSVSSNL